MPLTRWPCMNASSDVTTACFKRIDRVLCDPAVSTDARRGRCRDAEAAQSVLCRNRAQQSRPAVLAVS